jgi:hypothetical protein
MVNIRSRKCPEFCAMNSLAIPGMLLRSMLAASRRAPVILKG